MKADAGWTGRGQACYNAAPQLTNTPTRCDAMVVEPSPDLDVFKQIFADHWEAFQQTPSTLPDLLPQWSGGQDAACGNPEQMGYVEYRCLQCGQGTIGWR